MPEQLVKFRHFANAEENNSVPLIAVRGQSKPALWRKEYAIPEIGHEVLEGPRDWVKLGSVSVVPKDGGATFKFGRHQIVVFNFARRNK
jgi:hypothetical protein